MSDWVFELLNSVQHLAANTFTANMTTTRSARGNGSIESSPQGTKRAATTSASAASSLAVKRGKTLKKEQTTIEESTSGIEDDEDVEKQINGEKSGDTGERKEPLADSAHSRIAGLN